MYSAGPILPTSVGPPTPKELEDWLDRFKEKVAPLYTWLLDKFGQIRTVPTKGLVDRPDDYYSWCPLGVEDHILNSAVYASYTRISPVSRRMVIRAADNLAHDPHFSSYVRTRLLNACMVKEKESDPGRLPGQP